MVPLYSHCRIESIQVNSSLKESLPFYNDSATVILHYTAAKIRNSIQRTTNLICNNILG